MNQTHILQAVTDACRTIYRRPDDSIQDIFNQHFADYQLRLWMDHRFEISSDHNMIEHNLQRPPLPKL